MKDIKTAEDILNEFKQKTFLPKVNFEGDLLISDKQIIEISKEYAEYYHKAKVESTVQDIKSRILSLETDKKEFKREYANCGNENQKDFLVEQNATASLMIKSYNEILNKLLKE